LYFRAAVSLAIWGIRLSLSRWVDFYWHVVEWINESFKSLLGWRLEVFCGLTLLARLWVLTSAVPASLNILTLNRRHIISSGISFSLMRFFWVSKRVRCVWTGLRLNQLRNRGDGSLLLPLDQIRIVIIRLVRSVVLSCLDLLAGRTTGLQSTTAFFVKM